MSITIEETLSFQELRDKYEKWNAFIEEWEKKHDVIVKSKKEDEIMDDLIEEELKQARFWRMKAMESIQANENRSFKDAFELIKVKKEIIARIDNAEQCIIKINTLIQNRRSKIKEQQQQKCILL